MIPGTGHFAAIAILLIPATVCNAVILYYMATRNSLNTVPIKYISSMLRANLVAGIFIFSSVLVMMFSGEVAQNSFYCFGMNFIDRSLLAVATFSLVALSVERYKYFVQQSDSSFILANLVLATVWIVSFGFGLIYLTSAFFIKQANMVFGQLEGVCSLHHYSKLTGIIVHVYDLFGICLIPTIIMGIMYFKVTKKLWSAPSETLVQLKTKQKSVKMVIAISVVHMITWVPLSTFQIIYIGFHPKNDTSDDQKVQFASLFCRCIRYIIMPIIWLSLHEKSLQELAAEGSNRIEQAPPTRRLAEELIDTGGCLPNGPVGEVNVVKNNR